MSRLEDPLPEGNFDLVVSALAVHHLDGAGKADLFARVAHRLRPGGRFVLGDVVVPGHLVDVVTPIDGVYDQPSTIDDQVRWLSAAGLRRRGGLGAPRSARDRRRFAVLIPPPLERGSMMCSTPSTALGLPQNPHRTLGRTRPCRGLPGETAPSAGPPSSRSSAAWARQPIPVYLTVGGARSALPAERLISNAALARSTAKLITRRLLGLVYTASKSCDVSDRRTSVRRTPSNSQSFESNTPHAPPEVARVGLTARAACTPFGWV